MRLLLALLVAAPAKLAFVTSPGQVGTGLCSSKVTVELEDAGGVPAATATPVPLSLSGPAAFFSAADCTGNVIDPAGGLAIPGGGSNASFYFLHSRPGTLSLAVGSDPYPAVTQMWTVVARSGVATGLTFPSGDAVRVKPGQCSAAVGYAFIDINGALVSTPRALTVIYQPADFLEFYSDASCHGRVLSTDLPAASPGGQIYLLGRTSGVFTMRATSPGLNQGTLPVFVSEPSHGCASAGTGWAALGIVALLRRRH